MSRKRIRWGPLVAALGLMALAAPAPAASQQTEAELMQRLDSLQPLVEAAQGEAAEAKRLREEAEKRTAAATVDTFTVGLLTVLAVPEQRSLAEEMYGTIWEEEYAGHVQASPSLADHVFTFQWRAELEPIYVEGPHRRVESRPYRTRAMMEDMIRDAIGTVLELDLRAARRESGSARQMLHDWRWGPVRAPTQELATNVYRQLATSPSHETKGCLRGELDGCWTALGLGIEDSDEARLHAWYTPEERRAMVESRYRTYAMRFRQQIEEDEDYVGCVEQGVIEVCDSYLLEWSYRTPFPLDRTQARNAMSWFAVQAGGEGSWNRLLEDRTMTPEEALLYASGLPEDELARRWRDWVMEHQPTHAAALGGFGWGHLVTLFWILVLAAFALRSTRWRLG